jgi:hypothetical protein
LGPSKAPFASVEGKPEKKTPKRRDPPTDFMIHEPGNRPEIGTLLGLLRVSRDFAHGRLGRVDNIVR